MNILNSKICKGLNFTPVSVFYNSYDPDGLLLSTDWSNVPVPEGGWSNDEAGAIAACRAWYDATGYD